MKLSTTILIVLLSMASRLAFSQNVELQIDTLSISNVIREDNGEITFHDYGPVIKMIVSIKNNSDSLILLFPSKAQYFITFNYDGKSYQQETIPMAFMDYDSLQLLPKKIVQFYVAEDLFGGTPIYSNSKGDYTKELLMTLPTLKFKYNESNMSLTASDIKIVELAEY